jgi:hypothetical protein
VPFLFLPGLPSGPGGKEDHRKKSRAALANRAGIISLGGQRRTRMVTFTIHEDNHITAFAGAQEAAQTSAATATSFDSQAALAKVSGEWPLSRFVEIWNSVPGNLEVKKFSDRKKAVARIWKALQPLAGSAQPSEPAAKPKKPVQGAKPAKKAKAAKKALVFVPRLDQFGQRRQLPPRQPHPPRRYACRHIDVAETCPQGKTKTRPPFRLSPIPFQSHSARFCEQVSWKDQGAGSRQEPVSRTMFGVGCLAVPAWFVSDLWIAAGRF